MKEFYIAVDGQQKGAFSLEDLKHQSLLPDTLIWKEGWDNWQKVKDAAQTIPEIGFIINGQALNGKQATHAPKKKKNTLVTLARASEGDLGSIGSLMGIGNSKNGEEKDGGEQEQEEKAQEKPSFTHTIYQIVGRKIDEYLAANQSQIGSNALVTNLDKLRTYYKGLSKHRQRSFSFLVSAAVLLLFFLFLHFTIPTGGNVWDDIWIPFYYVYIWSAIALLYRVNFINSTVNTITNALLIFDFGLMPASIKQGIASVVKFLLFLVIGFFLGKYIGLPYLIYRIAIAFVDPDKLPNFEK